MANRPLTQRLIDTLKPAKSVRVVRDTELRTYGVRILPSGLRRFFVNVQINTMSDVPWNRRHGTQGSRSRIPSTSLRLPSR